jgi:hypothetical protein
LALEAFGAVRSRVGQIHENFAGPGVSWLLPGNQIDVFRQLGSQHRDTCFVGVVDQYIRLIDAKLNLLPESEVFVPVASVNLAELLKIGEVEL